MTIPTFPSFKNLELGDRSIVEQMTGNFLPYSDYNFVSLFSWDTENSIQLSLLGNNLVVKFRDYISNEDTYSFIGFDAIGDAIIKIIDYSIENNGFDFLKLIPEEVIEYLSAAELEMKIVVSEDRDNFDYIYSVQDLASLLPSHYQKKRNLSKRFMKDYPNSKIVALDLRDVLIRDKILELFYLWERQQSRVREDTKNELQALTKLLMTSEFSFVSVGIFIQDTLTSFSINEVLKNHFAVTHFEKFDSQFYGVSSYLKQVTAQRLLQSGCMYLNYEQDLGIPNLRNAKELLHPVRYLKKYTVKKITRI